MAQAKDGKSSTCFGDAGAGLISKTGRIIGVQVAFASQDKTFCDDDDALVFLPTSNEENQQFLSTAFYDFR